MTRADVDELARQLAVARANGRKLLIPFLTAGHPDPGSSAAVLAALGGAGADAIELGMPFSDPLADGPVIAAASERALAEGMTLAAVCRLAADRGPRRFPRRGRDREILMKSITMSLDGARTYSEAEINAALLAWKREVGAAIETDHVTLRRLLVDHGQLERTADGTAYRVGHPPSPVAFGLEVDDIDVRATIAAYREYSARRQRTSGAPPGRTSCPRSC